MKLFTNNLQFRTLLLFINYPEKKMTLLMSQITRSIPTEYGKIIISDSGGTGFPVLFIHGNSAAKEAFQKQFTENMTKNYRFIAMNLPGHGVPGAERSENARDPEKTYSLPGYADVAIEVLEKLNIKHVAVIGWSLGGHIALDMLKRWSGTDGILITGAPPIPLTMEGFSKGFKEFPAKHLMGQEKFTDEEAEMFNAQGGILRKESEDLFRATKKTHGLARKFLISSMGSGQDGNQQQIAETSKKPIAVVCGKDDTGINNEYIKTKVKYNNLWNDKVYFLDGGHAVFWQNSEEFNPILSSFLKDLSRKRQVKTNQKNCIRVAAVAIFAVALFKSFKM